MEEPCVEGCRSRYCFPCINGVCPYGKDFMLECYPKLTPEQRMLFDELFNLRAEIARRKLPLEVSPQNILTLFSDV